MALSEEVIEYICKILADYGIYFIHPYITKNNENVDLSAWSQIYVAAKHKAENGPFPIEANSLIDRQAIELMKMELYTKEIRQLSGNALSADTGTQEQNRLKNVLHANMLENIMNLAIWVWSLQKNKKNSYK